MSKEAQNAYKSRALRCHGCAARARAASQFGDMKGTEGLLFTVERVDETG